MLDLYLGGPQVLQSHCVCPVTAFPDLSIHIQVPSCWPQLLTHSGTSKQASRNSHPGLLAASSMCLGLGRIWWRLLKYKNPQRVLRCIGCERLVWQELPKLHQRAATLINPPYSITVVRDCPSPALSPKPGEIGGLVC